MSIYELNILDVWVGSSFGCASSACGTSSSLITLWNSSSNSGSSLSIDNQFQSGFEVILILAYLASSRLLSKVLNCSICPPYSSFSCSSSVSCWTLIHVMGRQETVSIQREIICLNLCDTTIHRPILTQPSPA